MAGNYLMDNEVSNRTARPGTIEGIGGLTTFGDGFDKLNKPIEDIQVLLDKYGIRRKVEIEGLGTFNELTNKRCWRDLGVTPDDWEILEGYCGYYGLDVYDRPYPNTRFSAESVEGSATTKQSAATVKISALKDKYAKKPIEEPEYKQPIIENPVPTVVKNEINDVKQSSDVKHQTSDEDKRLKKKYASLLKTAGIKVCNGWSLDVFERKMIGNNLSTK